MIDIKKFLVDILAEKIDPDIKLATGRQNEEIEKTVFIKNRESNDAYRYYKQDYFRQNCSIIVTWSENYTETREKAYEIFEALQEIKNIEYDEHTMIIKCEMESDFPDDVQSKKIYSQQIDFKIHYVIY